MTLLRRLSYTTLALAFAQIVFGAIVRITGSGLGCGDHWPTCNGQWFPPYDRIDLIIEITHRYIAAALTLSILFLLAAAIARRGHQGVGGRGGVLRPALLAAGVVVLAAVFGGVTVKLGLNPYVIVTHLAIAMALLAVLAVAVIRSGGFGVSTVWSTAPAAAAETRYATWMANAPRTYRAAVMATVMVFVILVFGALTANVAGANNSCQGFPGCRVIAVHGLPLWIQVTHRVLAFLLFFHLLGMSFAIRKRDVPPLLKRATWTATGIVTLQLLVAAALVEMHLPPVFRSLHQAVGTLVWLATFSLAMLARVVTRGHRLERGRPQRVNVASPPATSKPLLADLVMLTKPRIISLLLITTVAAMYVAGTPSWGLVLTVLVGGYLMAGGANAINMYMDRDIDITMDRTRLRPIPSGRMTPLAVLAFGIALATAATFVLARFANVLTAALALAGFYCYVFVYTRWLKRSTPQNIVIGGAAGAFPPLVGYAAVTGSLDLTAWILFLIIFYWTPPHFWALALLKQRDYGAAHVPMAPLVWGERQTADQMLWYTGILAALTVLPFCTGTFGWVYLGSALAITAPLVYGVILTRVRNDRRAPAAFVFKYSLLYLALLYAAMVADIHIPI